MVLKLTRGWGGGGGGGGARDCRRTGRSIDRLNSREDVSLLSTWIDVLERSVNFAMYMDVSTVCASL